MGIVTIPATTDSSGNVTGPILIDTRIPQVTLGVNWNTPAVTLFPNGISVPNNALALVAKLSLGTPGFTIPGFSIPGQPIPFRIDIDGQIDGFTTPRITIDRIPLDIGAGINGGQLVQAPGFAIAPIKFDPATVTIPGFTIPTGPIHITLPVSLTIPGFSTPAGGIPNLPLGLGLNFSTPAFDLPTAVIDRIAFDLHANSNVGPFHVPIFGFGGSPGFWNATTTPSSGFFNVGGGTGSGFWNSGTGMSGLLNVMSNASLGSSSGFYNFGTQLSGILNRGAGVSGLLNTGALGDVTSAVVSGFMNVGQRLSGLLYTGIGP